MNVQQKRAALFEYFKEINQPKWASNGQKLYDTIQTVKDDKVIEMYDRMVDLKKRQAIIKAKQEKENGYKPWKFPLFQTLAFAGFAVFFTYSKTQAVGVGLVYMLLAGAHLEKFLNITTHNFITARVNKMKMKKD